jgi:hypothetical protein
MVRMNRYDIALGKHDPEPKPRATLKFAEPQTRPEPHSQEWHERFAKVSAEVLMQKFNRTY